MWTSGEVKGNERKVTGTGQNQFFPPLLQLVPQKFHFDLDQKVDKVHVSISNLKSSLSSD